MTKQEIDNLFRQGLTIERLSKMYEQHQKEQGNKITLWEAKGIVQKTILESGGVG